MSRMTVNLSQAIVACLDCLHAPVVRYRQSYPRAAKAKCYSLACVVYVNVSCSLCGMQMSGGDRGAKSEAVLFSIFSLSLQMQVFNMKPVPQ